MLRFDFFTKEFQFFFEKKYEKFRGATRRNPITSVIFKYCHRHARVLGTETLLIILLILALDLSDEMLNVTSKCRGEKNEKLKDQNGDFSLKYLTASK